MDDQKSLTWQPLEKLTYVSNKSFIRRTQNLFSAATNNADSNK